MSDSITITTLGDVKRAGCVLSANCLGRFCGHGSELDIDELIARFGADHCFINEKLISSRLKCGKCGWHGARLHFQPAKKG